MQLVPRPRKPLPPRHKSRVSRDGVYAPLFPPTAACLLAAGPLLDRPGLTHTHFSLGFGKKVSLFFYSISVPLSHEPCGGRNARGSSRLAPARHPRPRRGLSGPWAFIRSLPSSFGGAGLLGDCRNAPRHCERPPPPSGSPSRPACHPASKPRPDLSSLPPYRTLRAP